MRRPSIDIPLIQASFVELEHILGWLEARRRRSTSHRALLVGGWAVHMYNAYYGSFDIDLLMNSSTKKGPEHHLIDDRGSEDGGVSVFTDIDPLSTFHGERLDECGMAVKREHFHSPPQGHHGTPGGRAYIFSRG